MAGNDKSEHILPRLIDAVGEETTHRIVKAFGGRPLYISRYPNERHQLAKVVGVPTARTIYEQIGAGRVMVPLADTSVRMRALAEVERRLAAGESTPTISSALGVHVRTVERMRRRLREEGRA